MRAILSIKYPNASGVCTFEFVISFNIQVRWEVECENYRDKQFVKLFADNKTYIVFDWVEQTSKNTSMWRNIKGCRSYTYFPSSSKRSSMALCLISSIYLLYTSWVSQFKGVLTSSFIHLKNFPKILRYPICLYPILLKNVDFCPFFMSRYSESMVLLYYTSSFSSVFPRYFPKIFSSLLYPHSGYDFAWG